MGYYTYFDLEIEEQGGYKEDLIEEFINSHEFIGEFIDDDGSNLDCAKWYKHEKDLGSFSKRFPNAVFKLIGNGDDSDDFWHKYFKNGKIQRCDVKFVYDDYKESNLEESCGS